MLKHFHLGRRAYFPALFLFAVVLIFGAGYWLFAATGSAAHGQPKTAFELMVTAVGAVAAFVYFLYDQHHKDTQMFVGLFEKFNTRYDGLNEKLNAIISRPIDSPLVAENITTLYDYFNLCAEEYLYYEAGYIDEKVWQAWLRGMSNFAANESVHRLWEKEIESGSYYGFKLCFPGTAGSPKCARCRPV